MNIPWKLKSNIFSFIDIFRAQKLLYLIQKYVTKRSQKPISVIDKNWNTHLQTIKKYSVSGVLFEFGAGKSLAQNLYLSQVMDNQFVVDLNHMIDHRLVERARESLSKLGIRLGSSEKVSNAKDLEKFGIFYRAPYDASKTDFESGSIDICVSTNTLEHIPAASITKIFQEMSRILKPSGIVSAKIDYSDHYAHTDRSITLHNFLIYTETQWHRYNHRCHYQNRLRHNDYVEIFQKCGFTVVEEELWYDEDDIDSRLEKKFEGNHCSWKATSAHFVLKKQPDRNSM